MRERERERERERVCVCTTGSVKKVVRLFQSCCSSLVVLQSTGQFNTFSTFTLGKNMKIPFNAKL